MHLGMTGRFTITAGLAEGRDARRAFTHEAGGDPTHDHVVFRMTERRDRHLQRCAPLRLHGPDPAAGLDGSQAFRRVSASSRMSNAFDAASLAEAAGPARRSQGAPDGSAHRRRARQHLRRRGALPRRAEASAPRAGASPTGAAWPTAKAEALVAAIRAVLGEAIDAGGSTLRDYRHTDGELGYFQKAHQVYDRAGEACLRPAAAASSGDSSRPAARASTVPMSKVSCRAVLLGFPFYEPEFIEKI